MSTQTSDTPLLLEVDDDGAIRLAGKVLFAGDDSALIDELSRLRSLNQSTYVMTPNVDQTIDLAAGGPFRESFNGASLRLIDGMPLVVLSRLLGAKNPVRHTGADLLPMIVSNAPDRQWIVVITGGSTQTSDRAAKNLRDSTRGADVRSVHFPKISSPSDPGSGEVVESLKSLKPDFVFLCLGAPKQELWYSHWADELPPAVYIGAGAAVDFAAGAASRAPGWVQSCGFEWLWRLAAEPRRLASRYLIKGPKFMFVILRSSINGLVGGRDYSSIRGTKGDTDR